MSSNTDTSSSSTDSRPARQPARRVFAHEFADATYIFAESDDDRAPKFALLPTGERANRVFVVGTLTETDALGNDDDFWRGRVVDPTGTHFVYAGQYQPTAQQQLTAIEPPAYVAVVGKPRSYTNDDGETYTSITAEALTVVESATRDRWVLETAEHTSERIDRCTRYRSSDDDHHAPADVVMASEQYGDDLSPYQEAVVETLGDLADEADPSA